MKLKGVKFELDAKGRIKKVTFDYKHHVEFLEDYLDSLAVLNFDESREKMHKFEDVKARLLKQHGIKPDDLPKT